MAWGCCSCIDVFAVEGASGGVKRGLLISFVDPFTSSFDLFATGYSGRGGTGSGWSIRLEMEGDRAAPSATVGFGGVDRMFAGGERCRATVDDLIGS